MADQEFRSTPEKYPTVGALSRLVGRVDKFARAPFGYSNPPVEMLSDLLEIPALYRTGENIAYGSPLTIGAGQARRMTEDTTGAIGGALNLLGPAASTAKLAVKGTKAMAPRAGALAQQLAVRTQPMPLQMNIVKLKGGNWLEGMVEDDLKRLKKKVDRRVPERYLRDLEAAYAQNVEAGIGDASEIERHRARLTPHIAVNRWVDKKLNPYIKNEMGTLEDPVRALAEEGILHTRLYPTSKEIAEANRALGGFPLEDVAKTPLGKEWERTADQGIRPGQAGERLSENKTLEEKNPWLLKVKPETLVYSYDYPTDKGFSHLTDELLAAVSPNSELPANLRLTVEQLDKVTMPQAVRRVAEINAWRANQAAEAEKQGLMGVLQATPRLKDESMQLSFVEKPGVTWVDVPETITKDNIKLCTLLGKAGGWCTQNEGLAESYGSGKSRLTTMIDAEGRPHAQAMITKPRHSVTVEQTRKYYPAATEEAKLMPNGYTESDVIDIAKRMANENQPQNITELKPPGNSFYSARSREYLKRDPDYKAKVTDSVLKFLNSGTWGKVNDLQEYDIVDLNSPSSVQNSLADILHYDLKFERADKFNAAVDANPNAPRFMSQRQLREFIEPSIKPEGFAKGGLVEYDPDHIESLAKSFDAEEFASGGAVRMGLGGFFKMVKSATGKAAKTAKAVEPEIDAGRRSFGKSLLNPTQSAENLPAAVPTSIANIPMSRRTFLRAAASPVVQSTLGSLAPALASQAPSVSSIVKQATAPVAASLSTPVKAGALNLLKQAHDLNVRHPLDFRDRAAVVRELAQYEGQPLVGEGGLSLKEFMRQLKADPKVYETLMKDLDYLGASVRHSYALPSKEAYLSYEPMSAATTAREARIWDKYEGRFKEPRVRGGEDSPPRMFDPNLSEFYYDYGAVDPAILPQLNKAMEGLPHDEARKIYKKAATEYQKLEKADKSKFYREAAKENSPFGKVLSTKDLYKREDTPASTMLSAFMLNHDKWFTLPTQDEFLNILRSKGLLPEGTQMDPEQLSSIYNNALGEAKSIVQSIPYDPRHEHIDKYYKGFGIDIPEYVPLSKRNPPPAEAEFASGGAVNYNQSHIDELAAQFHKEM